MELVTILRELWHRRTIVALVALVSLLVGAAVAFRLPSLESRKYEVGIATARILVDTPNSQVVEVAPKGSDMLGVRANLIANLMAEGDVKAAIAQRAGVPPEKLAGIAESADSPPDAASASTAEYVLTTRVLATPTGDHLPIIELEARAPDAMRAATLAGAALSGLSDYLDTKAAAEKVPDAERLRFTSLGPARAAEFVRGPGIAMAIGAALFVFIAGCAIMLGVLALGSRLARRRGGGVPHRGLPGRRTLRRGLSVGLAVLGSSTTRTSARCGPTGPSRRCRPRRAATRSESPPAPHPDAASPIPRRGRRTRFGLTGCGALRGRPDGPSGARCSLRRPSTGLGALRCTNAGPASTSTSTSTRRAKENRRGSRAHHELRRREP